MQKFFKNWAIPGVIPSGVLNSSSLINVDESLDALSGHYKIFQLKKGNRFSTDDLLVAWYGSSWCPSARNVLDLGSGIGSVAMTVAWRLPSAKVVTVEAQDRSVELARKSVQLNDLMDRVEIRHGDFRQEALIKDEEKFDLVLGSPPYFPVGDGLEGMHPQTVACRFETRGNIFDYCEVASEHLNHGGFFSCIFPIQPEHQKERVDEAAKKASLTIIRKRPIIFKEGDAPLLCLFGMMRSTDLPENFRNQTWEEPALTIRNKDGSVHPEYSAIKLSIGFPP
jgi:tRNA1Val (adenine37-N6)-methyltransferase